MLFIGSGAGTGAGTGTRAGGRDRITDRDRDGAWNGDKFWLLLFGGSGPVGYNDSVLPGLLCLWRFNV